MKSLRALFTLAASIALASCTQLTSQTPTDGVKAFGKLELTFDLGVNGNNISVRPQAVLLDSAITLNPVPIKGAYDDGTFRYIFATYEFTNTSGAAFDNLTLYAYNQAANNTAGTAIKNLVNFAGANSSSSAQSLKPTHGMETNGLGVANIIANREDLQIFSNAEANTADAAATPSIIGASDTVLEYGFVARAIDNAGNPTGARSIANGAKGRVTAAYKLPTTGVTGNAYSFTATFVVANETITRVSRSPEETTVLAAARATTTGASQVVLVGTDPDTTTGGIRLANAKLSTTPALLLEPSCVGGAFDPIYAIQGTGTAAALTGTRTTEGVVVGDFQSTDGSGLRGFYIQDRYGDGTLNTSDGIFIDQDTGANPTAVTTAVAVGDYVRITGAVAETFNLTRIVPTAITACGTRVTPTPTQVNFPLPIGQADLEKFEGMLIQIPSELTVTEMFRLGQFGQATLSSASTGTDNQPGTDNRLDQYTQFNPPSVAGNTAHAAALKKRSIIIDDGRSDSNPAVNLLGRGGNPLTATNTLRGGDTITNLTGIMDFSFSEYRIQPTVPANFVAANARPTTPTVGGTLRVASFNVLNYFTTLNQANFTPANCSNTIAARGADTALEFTRQKDKTVQAILGINPDVLGVIEMQNNGTTAINDLVSALNTAAGAGTYAAASVPTNGYGCDAIKVDFIYKPVNVTLNAIASPDDTVYTSFSSSGTGRRPVAATFTQLSNGAVFTAVMNHFKSKGSGTGAGNTDALDGQGQSNLLRTQNATDLKNWLVTNPTGTTDTDYLLMGDFNAYFKEDPLTTLETAGYTNLNPSSSYSYVFDGAWGSLDHAFGSASLSSQLAGAQKFHVSADEPTALDYNIELDNGTVIKTAAQIISLYAADAYRASDHDPVVVGLNLGGVANSFTVGAGALSNSNFVAGTGGTATSTITINRNAFPDPVTLSLEVSPANAGITASSFSNSPNSTGTSTLNLNVDNTVVAGNYTLTVKGTSGATVVTSNTFNITVAAPCSVTGVAVSSAGNATSVNVNGTLQVTASVNSTPANCSSAVTWSSSDTSKATVSSSGLVTGVAVGFAILTATSTLDNTKLGTLNLSVNAVAAITGLVINEVDYDQPGTDSTEYIEIYNPTASAVSLAGIKVFLVNGGASGNPSYTTVDLSSGVSLAANSYLVIANTTFLGTITASVEIAFAGANDQIQNGSPDGIALVNTNTNSIVDALSYEGSITAATLAGISGTFNLVEGTALPAPIADSNIVVGALIRSPNGTDTNNAFADWATRATLSPGAAN